LILKKPSRFDLNEYDVMKMHTIFGAQLFQDRRSDYDTAAAQVALNHHEWWNGRGYPGHVDVAACSTPAAVLPAAASAPGKKGKEIPIFGRIVSLADVYDALCSTRVYKESWDAARALSAIEQAAGTQFDPALVERFVEIVHDRDASRHPERAPLSSAARLSIVRDVEQIFVALNTSALSSLSHSAGQLATKASSQGLSDVADLASRIEEASAQGKDLFALSDLASGLMDACSATRVLQTASDDRDGDG